MCKCAPYRDHANSEELDNEKLPVRTKGGVYIPFPEKLFNMLQFIDLHECELATIVSWQPHGRCFRVHNIPRFESIVLPRFFTHQKNASFLRQLNLWNFKRIYKDPRDRGAYYHELFLRSKKFLHRNISRRNGKNKGPKHSSCPSGNCQSSSDNACEPNFYSSMKAMPPSLSAVDHSVSLVEGPRKVLPGESCVHAPWSWSRPDFDQANYNTAPVLPEFASLGWNTGYSCVQAPWSSRPDFDQANCNTASVLPGFPSLGWNTISLPRDDAKELSGASLRITRTPAESVACNGRITPRTPAEQYVACNGRAKELTSTAGTSRNCSNYHTFFDQAAANYYTTDEMMISSHRFGHDITASTNEDDDRIEQHSSRKLPSSSDSSGSSAPAARTPAVRIAAPVNEKLLNTNIMTDTTLYDHYQPHQQQHSEEAALEQRGRTVSSTTSTTSLFLEKNKEQEEPYYDSSRYGDCFTPLPEDFPPPSPEEWEEIIMVVRELV